MLNTMKNLCRLSGVSGWEDEVRDYILEQALPHANEIITDPMGNLFVLKKGAVTPEKPVMICAHMDEVGVIITGYGDDGYLRFDFVGGVDRRVIIGKRVYIGPDRIPGVIGLKAIHLISAEERKSVPKLDALYIDIGAETVEEAKEKVQMGWRGVFDDRIECFGNGLIKAKALDDRAGCAAMLKLMEQDLPMDTWFVFTVQEEVGCRGALTAANRLNPGWAIVLEGTTAADLPGVEAGKEVCRLGEGIVIPFMDRGTIYNRKVFDLVTSVAEKNGIAWQTKQRIAGGTDASAIQRSGEGVYVVTMAAPLRNIHSPASVGKLSDLETLPVLCRHLLEELAHGC